MSWKAETVEVIERCPAAGGEIQLQRRGSEYEIIYNGVFLMATYNGASERAAIRHALDIAAQNTPGSIDVLIGGLGAGYSLQEALSYSSRINNVCVVEIEPVVIRWNRTFFKETNGNALDDSRTILVEKDFREVLQEQAEKNRKHAHLSYNVIMVDTDNGSDWLSLPSNAFFYSFTGLELIKRCLHPGGVACFWFSRRDEAFERQLRNLFKAVSFHSVLEKTGQEGCYYLSFSTQSFID